MSFVKTIGSVEMAVNVSVKQAGDRVHVTTTASTGKVALRGLMEEEIRNFHVLLFRTLGITDMAERNIDIQVAK